MGTACENLDRQLSELEAVDAMYPEEMAMDSEERESLMTAQRVLHVGGICPEVLRELRPISGRITLLEDRQHTVVLRFSLPRGYPSDDAPDFRLELAVPRSMEQALYASLSEELSAHLAAQQGEEILLTSIALLQERAIAELRGQECSISLLDNDAILSSRQNGGTEERHSLMAPRLPQRPVSIAVGRRIVWFHHIKSVKKRKHIVEWAHELRLGGFSKPGFPGVVIIEGAEDSAAEYILRLKQLRWQALAVRAEDIEVVALGALEGADDAIARARKLPSRFCELPESGLSVLGQSCKQAGLEDMFLAALKISTS